MIDADFIRAIEDLVEGKALELVIDGVPMSNVKLHDNRPRLPEPAALELNTLAGLVDYVLTDIDGIVPSGDVDAAMDDPAQALAVHVVSPVEVRLVGELRGTFRQRFTYARAVHRISAYAFGQWYEHEEFVIRLGTMFEDADDRAAVIKLVGTVTEEQGVKTEDDGITQTVHVKQGITFIGREEVPNPVTLAPFRTFHEVPQTPGTFLLRARGGRGKALEWALFEADGGAWANVAIESIAEYLAAKLAAKPEAVNIPIIR